MRSDEVNPLEALQGGKQNPLQWPQASYMEMNGSIKEVQSNSLPVYYSSDTLSPMSLPLVGIIPKGSPATSDLDKRLSERLTSQALLSPEMAEEASILSQYNKIRPSETIVGWNNRETIASAEKEGSFLESFSVISPSILAKRAKKLEIEEDEGKEEAQEEPEALESKPSSASGAADTIWLKAKQGMSWAWSSLFGSSKLVEAKKDDTARPSDEDIATPLPARPELRPYMPVDKALLEKCVHELAVAQKRLETLHEDIEREFDSGKSAETIIRDLCRKANISVRQDLNEQGLIQFLQHTDELKKSREMMEKIYNVHGNIIDKKEMSDILWYVNAVAGGVAFVSGAFLLVASGGTAIIALGLISGVSSFISGTGTIGKGIIDYKGQIAQGELSTLKIDREVLLNHIDNLTKDVKALRETLERYDQMMAAQLRSEHDTIQSMA